MLRASVSTFVVALMLIFTSAAVGATDKQLSKSELKHLIATAKEPADHERIAEYFDAEARKYEAEARDHAELAPYYKEHTSSQPTKYPGSMQTFQHCDSLSKSLMKAAEDAHALAAEHRALAKQAK
ncbi:MAG: hypothetical protein ACJ746_00175 [Bryobacteraceae bacterium]